MARLARVVIADLPHHVTQRGNRRQQTFFEEDDYRLYLDLLKTYCAEAGVSVWGWCLMPNHVHLMLVPKSAVALRAGLGETHRRYSRQINMREGWRGYLWQGRFASAPMNTDHVLACARYIELNPVRAKLVSAPEDWSWSSAKAHLSGVSEGVTQLEPLAFDTYVLTDICKVTSFGGEKDVWETVFGGKGSPADPEKFYIVSLEFMSLEFRRRNTPSIDLVSSVDAESAICVLHSSQGITTL